METCSAEVNEQAPYCCRYANDSESDRGKSTRDFVLQRDDVAVSVQSIGRDAEWLAYGSSCVDHPCKYKTIILYRYIFVMHACVRGMRNIAQTNTHLAIRRSASTLRRMGRVGTEAMSY